MKMKKEENMSKKLVYGWGINDVNGSYREKYYKVWSKMLERVKSESCLTRHPTYRDCSICEEWKYLSNFKQWFEQTNYIDGYVLDKDLYIPDNKLYSPENCLLIPHNINQLINRQNGKGYSKLPSGRYRAMISINGKNISLGIYDTEEEAHQVYIEFKANYYVDIADEYYNVNNKIWVGLYRHAEHLLGLDWKETLPYYE